MKYIIMQLPKQILFKEADFSRMPRARYAFVVYAYDERQGGWVRLGRNFRTSIMAWKFNEMMWHLLVFSGDYEIVDVTRSLKFK